MRWCWWFVVATLLLKGCDFKRPPVEEERLVAVLVDLHIAAPYIDLRNPLPADRDSVGHGMYPEILKRHNLTRDSFFAGIAYYQQRPKQLQALYEKVIQRITVLQQESDGATPSDSSNLPLYRR